MTQFIEMVGLTIAALAGTLFIFSLMVLLTPLGWIGMLIFWLLFVRS